MNIWGKKINLENEKFYKFLQKNLEKNNYHNSPSELVIDNIKKHARSTNTLQNSIYNFLNIKFIIPSVSLILIIILITTNYSTENKIYVYQEQFLDIDNQTLFVTDDILSNDELVIQYALMKML